VKLFREGKDLSLKCERLLKDAQTSIEAAAATPLFAGDARSDDRP
jgi:exonuclease VII small subunit